MHKMKVRTALTGLLLTLGLFAGLHHAHSQTSDTTGQPVMTDPNQDVSNLSDLEVELKALEMATPLAASNAPSAGNFYSAQHAPGSAEEWPPLPANMFNLPIWPLDTNVFVIDDLNFNYGGDSVKILKGSSGTLSETLVRADDEGPPTPPGGGSGGDTNLPPTPHIIPQDYGTNLWIAQWGMASNILTAIASNTVADVEYEIQTNSNLTTTNWAGTGQFILGSETTNWTQFILPPPLSTNNLFFRLQSQASSDGSGLPSWWETKYFGTNEVNPNAPDGASDGWSIYQKFELGFDPRDYYTPLAPQLSLSYNVFNGVATLNWTPVLTPVTSYTVERIDVYYTFKTTNTFSLAGSVNSLQDAAPTFYTSAWANGLEYIVYSYYTIQAQYSSGNSAWSDPVILRPDALAVVNLLPGPSGSAYLAVASLPSKTATLRFSRIDPTAESHGDYSSDDNLNIPVAALTNGIYELPTSITGDPTDAYGTNLYQWQVQLVDESGATNPPENLAYNYFSAVGNFGLVAPYVDGRIQLKQNLAFLLRAGLPNAQFQYQEESSIYNDLYTNPVDYAYSGFNQTPSFNAYANVFDPLTPFENNYFFRNFVFSLSDVDSSGRMATGIGDDSEGNGEFTLTINVPPVYQFQSSMISGTNASAVLYTNEDSWLASYPLTDNGLDLGISSYYDGNSYYAMTNDVKNIFGLLFLSVKLAWGNSGGDDVTLPSPGVVEDNEGGYVYPQAAQPQYQTTAYDFWIEALNGVSLSTPPLPGNPAFTTTNASQMIFAPVGSGIQIAGYAKLALLNGFSGKYAYLGQYFNKAYEVDTNGAVTTNTTGVLSPYGNFFATQPGTVALTTMPDPDTGQQGTCAVYCVSLALDKNHDGAINSSFNSPDATSPGSPYVFWCNNNYDRLTLDSDDNTNYDDDVEVADCPATPGIAMPDYNYRDAYAHRVIPCVRDLQDFARLWVCGVTTNLLAGLPPGSTVALNWGDIGNPNDNNPTIDVFTAADANGGMGYLTNETVADQQTNISYFPYIGTVGPGSNLVLNASQFANRWAGNHFIWCGLKNGIGSLNLTISDANNNVLVQATAYIQIKDIKQMYERWTIGDDPKDAPLTNALLATDDGYPANIPGFQYPLPNNTNTAYILLVHGWNNEIWNKDRFAESAFKRLYWQGYSGRFGSFRWPTTYGFTGSLWQALTDPDSYDDGEHQAWQSAQGLMNKLVNLNTEYPGHVYVLAHSMGNVVASEALRLAAQANTGQIVKTYIASQGAISAHGYDSTVTSPYLLPFTYKYPSGALSGLGTKNYGPYAPDIYVNRMTNNVYAVGERINFYNVNDFALAMPRWGFDSILRPNHYSGGYNFYNGSVNDAAPWNNFEFVFYGDTPTTYFNIVSSLSDRYQVLAYAAPSYSTPLGATPGIANFANLNLSEVWLPDPTGNNYSAHFWHSAEFRGDCWQEWGYWNTLLHSDSQGFNINP